MLGVTPARVAGDQAAKTPKACMHAVGAACNAWCISCAGCMHLPLQLAQPLGNFQGVGLRSRPARSRGMLSCTLMKPRHMHTLQTAVSQHAAEGVASCCCLLSATALCIGSEGKLHPQQLCMRCLNHHTYPSMAEALRELVLQRVCDHVEGHGAAIQ